jgi:ribosomal protein S18 acetylase RimI-like enzyme
MIRPRREEDLERCVALLRRVHEVDRYPVVWPSGALAWLAGRDPLAAWVAEDDGQLLGHLSLHATDDSRARPQWREALAVGVERLAVVSRFFVAPEARGRGIGAALMDRAQQHAAAARLELVLDVAEHNRDAIAFYERRGWRRVGSAELPLSGDPWRLRVVLFVLGA